MSVNLSVRPHASKGRALHTTKALKPGQIIATFSPTLLLTSSGHLKSICSYCFKRGEPRACKQCRVAYYCDAKCQVAAWQSVHKSECMLLTKSVSSVSKRREMPTPIRALIQILLNQGLDGGVLKDLEGHVSQRRGQPGWADWEMMAMAACAFAGLGTEEEVVSKAVSLLCKIHTNAFHRYDADLGEHGVFLEPTLAMVNHSCIPNAVVQFIGRNAVLRAETAIPADGEIEISYTDNTTSLSKRQESLVQYSFECECSRCKNDLNVYQVCSTSPNINLNTTSLISDLQSRILKQEAVTVPEIQKIAQELGTEAVMMIEHQQLPPTLPEKEAMLRQQLKICEDLVAKNLLAVSPVPQVLTELSILFSDKENYAYSLSIACLIAVECDGYRYPAPFHPSRVKTLLMIAKLLANTAAAAAEQSSAVQTSSSVPSDLYQKVLSALQEIDQVSLCQMLVIMILQSVPIEQMAEWDLIVAAKDMLQDIESLPGRENETSLIEAWKNNRNADESKPFFEYAVVQQINNLATLGRAVIDQEF